MIDEQAVYDPSDRDDKLLLDIKGTMSEAELHWLGLRLIGALRSRPDGDSCACPRRPATCGPSMA